MPVDAERAQHPLQRNIQGGSHACGRASRAYAHWISRHVAGEQ